LIGAFAKNPEQVGDAARSHAFDHQADLDGTRIGQRGEIAAARFDHQADRIAAVDVQQSRFDEPLVHRAVEPLIVDGIVDVAISIVVGPAQRHAVPPAIMIAAARQPPRYHAAS
jgi:hypothetical protein